MKLNYDIVLSETDIKIAIMNYIKQHCGVTYVNVDDIKLSHETDFVRGFDALGNNEATYYKARILGEFSN